MSKAVYLCFILLVHLSASYANRSTGDASSQGRSLARPSQEQVTSRLSAPTGYVNDFAGVVDESTKRRLENTLKNLKGRAGIEFKLVTVETTGGQDIFEFSRKVASDWNIGLRSTAKETLLLVVAVKEKALFTQFTRAAQAKLPDGILGEIRQRMQEPISSGRVSEGLTNGIRHFVNALAKKNGFSVKGIDESDSAVARVDPLPPLKDSKPDLRTHAKTTSAVNLARAKADETGNRITSLKPSPVVSISDTKADSKPDSRTTPKTSSAVNLPRAKADETGNRTTTLKPVPVVSISDAKADSKPDSRTTPEANSGGNLTRANTDDIENRTTILKQAPVVSISDAKADSTTTPNTTSAGSSTRANTEEIGNPITTLKPSPVAISDSKAEVPTAANQPRTTPVASENISNTINSNVEPEATRKDDSSTIGAAREAIEKPALIDNYKVGIGDVLTIATLNTPTNRSTLYTVSEGGLIDFPEAGGPISVAGLTTNEIQTRLESELKRRAEGEDARLTVGVRHYSSHTVTVTGLVNHTGRRVLKRETVPLYVIISEVQPRDNARRVTIIRPGYSAPPLDLHDPVALNFEVRPGDVINVAPLAQEFYYIGGRIKRPGQKPFQPGITLLQAILAAGGLSESSAHKIELLREGPDGRLKTSSFDLRDIKSGKVPDPRLQLGDSLEIVN